MSAPAVGLPVPPSTVHAKRRSLVGGEILKLRRRRLLIVTSICLTIGASLFVEAVIAIAHAGSARPAPMGGTDKFRVISFVLSQLWAIVGVLLGAVAGSGDVSAGSSGAW